MNQIKLDMHTHTLASGHAYATINEMALSASEKGLELLGITEHTGNIPGTCEDFYFLNYHILPRNLYGVDMMFGAEINIVDYNGTLDLAQQYIDNLDLVIAGIHGICYPLGSIDQNTSAVIGAIKNPNVNIISHPDDGNCPLDYVEVVKAAKEYHVLLEVNNNALRSKSRLNVEENIRTIISLCKEYDAPFICGSDAHFIHDVANFDHVAPIIDSMDVPEHLIMNYNPAAFREYIKCK